LLLTLLDKICEDLINQIILPKMPPRRFGVVFLAAICAAVAFTSATGESTESSIPSVQTHYSNMSVRVRAFCLNRIIHAFVNASVVGFEANTAGQRGHGQEF
jgi:hypothetical protein